MNAQYLKPAFDRSQDHTYHPEKQKPDKIFKRDSEEQFSSLTQNLMWVHYNILRFQAIQVHGKKKKKAKKHWYLHLLSLPMNIK